MHLVVLTFFIIILSASAVDLLDFQCPSLLFFPLLFVMQWELTHTHKLMWCMWGENWVVSFWLWGVWICMMAVGFSSSQAWCRAATLLLNTLSVTGIYHCACVPMCLSACVRPRKQESCYGLPNKQPGGTFLNRSACLCASDRKPVGLSKASESV